MDANVTDISSSRQTTPRDRNARSWSPDRLNRDIQPESLRIDCCCCNQWIWKFRINNKQKAIQTAPWFDKINRNRSNSNQKHRPGIDREMPVMQSTLFFDVVTNNPAYDRSWERKKDRREFAEHLRSRGRDETCGCWELSDAGVVYKRVRREGMGGTECGWDFVIVIHYSQARERFRKGPGGWDLVAVCWIWMESPGCGWI